MDDRREGRDAMAAAIEGFGAVPAFADSEWAASVAAGHAEDEGEPYDLILIRETMEAFEAGARAPVARVDAVDLGRLLSEDAAAAGSACGGADS